MLVNTNENHPHAQEIERLLYMFKQKTSWWCIVLFHCNRKFLLSKCLHNDKLKSIYLINGGGEVGKKVKQRGN